MKKIALLFAVTAAVAGAAMACGDMKPPTDPSALGMEAGVPEVPSGTPSGAPSAPAMPGK